MLETIGARELDPLFILNLAVYVAAKSKSRLRWQKSRHDFLHYCGWLACDVDFFQERFVYICFTMSHRPIYTSQIISVQLSDARNNNNKLLKAAAAVVTTYTIHIVQRFSNNLFDIIFLSYTFECIVHETEVCCNETNRTLVAR